MRYCTTSNNATQGPSHEVAGTSEQLQPGIHGPKPVGPGPSISVLVLGPDRITTDKILEILDQQFFLISDDTLSSPNLRGHPTRINSDRYVSGSLITTLLR